MSADTLHHGPVPPGRLRIYLGYAPGAGTTCALLSEGHQRAAHGTDVVVAIAETHGRPHTAGLLLGLEVIPRARTPHHGTAAEEMDLDAVLARRPAVALVDDLACRNGRGAGHTRRWQDAGELLAAGIDVIATVGVGQLESLSDVVEKITGVPRRETVPDPVVRAAGEVELVDVVPQALRDRMGHGHIYPAERAEAALDGAFRMGTLSALRELALLWLAGKLASDPQRYRPSAQARGDSHARERVVVALGGTYHQLADADIPAALLAFARAENATQLVLGATRRTWLAALRPTTTIRSHLIRRGGGIGVHIVPCPLTANGVPRRRVLRIRALIRGEEQ